LMYRRSIRDNVSGNAWRLALAYPLDISWRCFVGRLDAVKGVLIAAEVVRQLVVRHHLHCGLPVLACQRSARHVMQGEQRDGLLVANRDPAVWLAALEPLLHQPALLREMGQRARQAVERQVPTWQQVLTEDLLPAWR
jgi:hypothetical protein